jgi:hypothetical protein
MAAIAIQRGWRKYKTRRNTCAIAKDPDAEKAVIKTQAAYKGFKVHQSMNFANTAVAALKIQSAYRGYRTRKKLCSLSELPDLSDKEIEDAALKIQSAFRGHKVREGLKIQNDSDMPDVEAKEVLEAAIMIQKTYKGLKTREELKGKLTDKDLPNLDCKDVEAAAILIQSVYKGFSTRKNLADKVNTVKGNESDGMPDLCNEETLAAALKIQSAFKGYKIRKTHKVPMTPQPSIDFEHFSPSDILNGHLMKRVPPVPSRFDSVNAHDETVSKNSPYSDRVPTPSQSTLVPKSPLAARSTRLKEVAIPRVPLSSDSSGSSTSSTKTVYSAPITSKIMYADGECDNSGTGFFPQTLLHKDSLQNLFRKASELSSPETPADSVEKTERGRRRSSISKVIRDAGESLRSRSKSKEREKKALSVSIKAKDDSKSKIGGFFSSMFKKAEKAKPKDVITPDVLSPDMKAITNVEFKFDGYKKNGSDLQYAQPEGPISLSPKKISQKTKSHGSSSDTESASSPDNISRQNSKEELDDEKLKQFSKDKVNSAVTAQEKHIVNRNNSSVMNATKGNKKAISLETKTKLQNDEDLKKDLIHVVMTAVEENWLNQAPKPTLDKAKALQAPDSDPELENSERSTSEADYMKKKIKAQKSQDLESDDEGAQLCKQESADGEFPFMGTTLPQERSGVVTITPSKQRLSDCKLASIDRPRSLMPRKATNLTKYAEAENQQAGGSPNTSQGTMNNNNRTSSKEKITVILPRQESKGKLRNGKTVSASTGISKETRSDWVDCEKIPESKKAIRKYDGAGCEKSHKKPVSLGEVRVDSPSIQTLSGTQIGKNTNYPPIKTYA